MQHDLIESKVFTNVHNKFCYRVTRKSLFCFVCLFVFFKEIILCMFTGQPGFYRFRALGSIQFFLELSLSWRSSLLQNLHNIHRNDKYTINLPPFISYDYLPSCKRLLITFLGLKSTFRSLLDVLYKSGHFLFKCHQNRTYLLVF